LGAILSHFVANRVAINLLLVPTQMDVWQSLKKLCSEAIDFSFDDEKMRIMADRASILHEHNAS
jgi:hypothetical protein